MRTISQMRDEIKRLMQEISDIEGRCQVEDREPTDNEIDHMRGCLDTVKDLEVRVALAEDVEKKREALEQPVNEVTRPDPENRQMQQARDNKDKFANAAEFFAAVIRADSPGGKVDPRLHNVRAATGLSESVPSDGGWLVQQDISSQLLKQAFDTGVLASRCQRVTISSNANSIKINGIDETSRATGSRWGGITGYWLEEAGEKTASTPKFRKIELSLNKLIGLCYATDELLADASALEGIIKRGFAEEIAFQLDDAIINGSGAGQPLGILNAGCLVTASKQTGQTATTLIYQNVIDMWTRLFAKSRGDAVWLINQDVEGQLYQMSLAVGTGGAPVYLPAGGASSSPYSSLFGRPVIPIEQCQTLGTAGDIYLCDFKNGYILAEKGGVSTDMSIHVRFVYDESVLRFVFRVDGQPVLSSAITPFKGSNTLSHFINLEAR